MIAFVGLLGIHEGLALLGGHWFSSHLYAALQVPSFASQQLRVWFLQMPWFGFETASARVEECWDHLFLLF